MDCPVYTVRDEEDPGRLRRYTCGRPANTPCVDPHPFAGLTVCEWHSTFTEPSEQGFVIGFTCDRVS